ARPGVVSWRSVTKNVTPGRARSVIGPAPAARWLTARRARAGSPDPDAPAGCRPCPVAGSLRPWVAGEKCERPTRGRRDTRVLRPLPDHRRRWRQILWVLRREADRDAGVRRIGRRDGSGAGGDGR